MVHFTAESSMVMPPELSPSLRPTTLAEEAQASYNNLHRTIYQYKRKGGHLDEAPAPCKLYMTEEKMVARMNELHISNEYQTETSSRPRQHAKSLQELEARLALDDDLEDRSLASLRDDPVVVLSPELQRLHKTQPPLLPSPLLQKISQKPTMELVLWKPPGGIVDSLIKAVSSKSSTTVNDSRHHVTSTNRAIVNNNNNDDDYLSSGQTNVNPLLFVPSYTSTAPSCISSGVTYVQGQQPSTEEMEL